MKLISLCFLLVVSSFEANAQSFADEAKDFNVSPRVTTKGWPYTGETPLTIPGAKTISTVELKNLKASGTKPIVLDVLGDKKMIQGALSVAGSGTGELNASTKEKFEKVLNSLSQSNKATPLVFYCHHSRCWWSYNAALHAVSAGFTNVHWYRGGIDAWNASGGETVELVKAEGW